MRPAKEHNIRAPSAGGRRDGSRLGRVLLAVGIGGGALTAICCAAPFLLAGALTAVGLGFILNETVLVGLLVTFLAVAALGYHLARGKKPS